MRRMTVLFLRIALGWVGRGRVHDAELQPTIEWWPV